MSDEQDIRATIRATFAPMHTNAAEAGKCVGCQRPTYQVVSGTLEDDSEAWFVPLCEECHKKRQQQQEEVT